MKVLINIFKLIFLLTGLIKIPSQSLIYPDIPYNSINDIVFVNDSTGYFITKEGSIYITRNNGVTWKLQRYFQRSDLLKIEFIDEKQGFILSPSKLLYSENSDDGWRESSINMEDVHTFLPLSKTRIIKADHFGQISVLDNFYNKWEIKYKMPWIHMGCLPYPYGEILQFANLGNSRILALCDNRNAKISGILRDSLSYILESLDEGNSWNLLWAGFKDFMTSFVFVDNLNGWMVGKDFNIYKTVDGGRSWIIQYSNPDKDFYFKNVTSENKNDVFAIKENSEIVFSNDGGITWKTKQFDGFHSGNSTIKSTHNKTFLIGNNFLKRKNNENSWTEISKSYKTNFYNIDFINQKLGWGIGDKEILKSIEGGKNWTVQYVHSDDKGGRYIEMIDSLEGWALFNTELLHSTNGGKSWKHINLIPNISYMRGITFFNKQIGVVFEVRKTNNNSVYNIVTTDGGQIWSEYPIKCENQNSEFISSLFKMKFTDKDHLWFINQQGVWLSKDTARTWNNINNKISGWRGFDFYDSLTSIAAINHSTMAFTKDGWKSWEYLNNPQDFQATDIEIVGNTVQGLLIIACGCDGKMLNYYYRDNPSLSSGYIYSFSKHLLHDIDVVIIDNRPNIWWVGDNSTVIYRLSEYLFTDIEEEGSNKTKLFLLSQNYPNPFNPITTIKYSLANSGIVKLKVFDILGREVAILVDQEQESGEYQVEFNATTFSSGIYFYRLQVGDFSEIKKMVVLK